MSRSLLARRARHGSALGVLLRTQLVLFATATIIDRDIGQSDNQLCFECYPKGEKDDRAMRTHFPVSYSFGKSDEPVCKSVIDLVHA